MGGVRAAARVVARRAAHAGAQRSPPSAAAAPHPPLVAVLETAGRARRACGGGRARAAARARDGGGAAAGGARRTHHRARRRPALWAVAIGAPNLCGARCARASPGPAALVDGVGVHSEALGQLAAGNGAAMAARRCEPLALAAAVLPCALIDSDGDSDGDGAQPAGGGAPRLLPRRRPRVHLASLACGARRAAVGAPAVATAADALLTWRHPAVPGPPSASPPAGASEWDLLRHARDAPPGGDAPRACACGLLLAMARGGAAVRAAALLARALLPLAAADAPLARQRRAASGAPHRRRCVRARGVARAACRPRRDGGGGR